MGDKHALDSDKTKDRSEGFLMDFWECIFRFLGKISIFTLVLNISEKVFKKSETHGFVDKWVFGNFIASVVCSYLVSRVGGGAYEIIYIILVYSILRVFEIIIYQINVFLFDPYRKYKKNEPYKIKSVRRMILALLHNYIEVIFWYTTILISIIIITYGKVELTWIEYVVKSFLCIATFSFDELVKDFKGTFGVIHIVAILEVISGLIMTIISLARFIGALPGLKELIEEE